MSSEALKLAGELDEEAERRVCHVAMAPASLLKDSATELRNLLAANLHMKDLTDQALDDVRRLTAERDQLRAEVERLRKPLTDEQIDYLKHYLSADRDYEEYTGRERLVVEGHREFARAIEAAKEAK